MTEVTPTNRIIRFLPDPNTVPAPRWSPPEPPERLPVAFWLAVGFAAGLVTAWLAGGGR